MGGGTLLRDVHPHLITMQYTDVHSRPYQPPNFNQDHLCTKTRSGEATKRPNSPPTPSATITTANLHLEPRNTPARHMAPYLARLQKYSVAKDRSASQPVDNTTHTTPPRWPPSPPPPPCPSQAAQQRTTRRCSRPLRRGTPSFRPCSLLSRSSITLARARSSLTLGG